MDKSSHVKKPPIPFFLFAPLSDALRFVPNPSSTAPVPVRQRGVRYLIWYHVD
jgi:hypothetical protein